VSRVGKKPIEIPSGVDVQVQDHWITVKGPKGTLEQAIHPAIEVQVSDRKVIVSRQSNQKAHRALHGLVRSLIANMIHGVVSGYEKRLEIVGVGYKAEVRANRLNLTLGYSHSILFVPPEGIHLIAETPTAIVVRGIDKQLVGQVAAKIRSFKPPEPYKGKGIKYEGEYIRRKAGKAAA